MSLAPGRGRGRRGSRRPGRLPGPHIWDLLPRGPGGLPGAAAA